MVKNYINPKMISIRSKKIEIIDEAMNSDPLIRIQYSAKKAGISNSWKKWIGEIQGLERMNTIGRKQEFESELTQWIDSDSKRKAEYGDILTAYGEIYVNLREYTLVNSFTNELINGVEAFALARRTKELADMYENNAEAGEIQRSKDNLIEGAGQFFKDYNMVTDQKLFVAMMNMYGESLDEKWLSPLYLKMRKEYKADFSGIAAKIYSKTPFADEQKYSAFIKGFQHIIS